MMKFSHLKRRIGIIINKSFLRPAFEKCNLIFCHWGDRQYTAHPGREDETIVIIRPQTDTQGLLSSYLYVLKYVRWARENAFVPYVDFESKKCQYYTGRVIHGSSNAWEYYFEQPSNLDKSSISSAKTAVYSGWTLFKNNSPVPIPKRPESALDSEVIEIARAVCPIRSYIRDIVDRKYQSLFSGSVLGVFLRGTDYAQMKPKGHARQPELDDVIVKIDEYLNEYEIDRIFVVTEDLKYFSTLRERYGEMVFSSDEYFIDNYHEGEYVESAFTNDAYERGLNYLVRILLFGRCDYVISGITNGSVVANILKEKTPIASYWFDLGLY